MALRFDRDPSRTPYPVDLSADLRQRLDHYLEHQIKKLQYDPRVTQLQRLLAARDALSGSDAQAILRIGLALDEGVNDPHNAKLEKLDAATLTMDMARELGAKDPKIKHG